MKTIAKILALTLALTALCVSLVACGEDTAGGLETETLSDNTCRVIGYGDFEGTELVIPEEINGSKVTAIGDLSGNKTITKVVLPDSVTTIGMGAFKSCTKLAEIQLPSGLTALGAAAFNGCSSLKTVQLPETLTSIGMNTFIDCTALTEVVIPDSVTVIGANAFYGCTSLTSVTLPKQLEKLEQSAFQDCTALTSVTVGNVTKMGVLVFGNCTSLKELTLGNVGSFQNNDVPMGSFVSGCTALETLTLGGEFIPGKEFFNLPSLKTVYIGTDVQRFSTPFEGCEALETVVYGGTQEAWNQLNKDPNWSKGSGVKVVKCSDGDIVLRD